MRVSSLIQGGLTGPRKIATLYSARGSAGMAQARIPEAVGRADLAPDTRTSLVVRDRGWRLEWFQMGR